MADEKKTTGHEEQAPPVGPGGSKAPPVSQAEQQPVQLGIENPDAPASDKKAENLGRIMLPLLQSPKTARKSRTAK